MECASCTVSVPVSVGLLHAHAHDGVVHMHRDKELAKFEAYLNKEDCQSINALVRGRTRMAYPIKG